MRKLQAADDKPADTDTTTTDAPIAPAVTHEVPPHGGTFIRRPDGTLEREAPAEADAATDKEA